MLLPLTEGLSLIYEYRLEILFLLLGIWAGGICIINTGILKDLHGLFRYIGVFCLGFLLLSGATFLIAFLSLFSRTSYLSGCYIISIFAALLIIKSFITSKNKTKILGFMKFLNKDNL